jgi:hypothetical protein
MMSSALKAIAIAAASPMAKAVVLNNLRLGIAGTPREHGCSYCHSQAKIECLALVYNASFPEDRKKGRT